MEGQDQNRFEQIAADAFAQAPLVYANGYVNGVGLTDSYVVLQANGRAVAVVNLPLTIAKALGASLTQMVADYETQTGTTVPDLG